MFPRNKQLQLPLIFFSYRYAVYFKNTRDTVTSALSGKQDTYVFIYDI